MRVLITGGAGYIGSHTLLELLGQGHEVCVIDNYTNIAPVVRDRVRALSNGTLNDHRCDIRHADGLAATMDDFRPDAVVHGPSSGFLEPIAA